MATNQPIYQQLLKRALGLLSRREYSEQELRDRLIRPSFNKAKSPFDNNSEDLPKAIELDPIIDQVIDYLRGRDWLSNQRAAESVVRNNKSRYGRTIIQHKLEQKGISSEQINQSLSTLASTESEYTRAENLWTKRFGHLDISEQQSPKDRAKQWAYLARRGFSSDVVRAVLSAKGDRTID